MSFLYLSFHPISGKSGKKENERLLHNVYLPKNSDLQVAMHISLHGRLLDTSMDSGMNGAFINQPERSRRLVNKADAPSHADKVIFNGPRSWCPSAVMAEDELYIKYDIGLFKLFLLNLLFHVSSSFDLFCIYKSMTYYSNFIRKSEV